MGWKLQLKDHLEIETFNTTTAFLDRAHNESNFLNSFDLIATDYHFAPGDHDDGTIFAANLAWNWLKAFGRQK